MSSSVVTLLTDFGLRDPYVGMMKGVILSQCPGAAIVDITHHIPPQDVATGAFILERSVKYFPVGTVHLAVVDPGVGTERRPLLIVTRNFFLVGPDNGLLSFAARVSRVESVVHLTEEAFFLPSPSSTFHGRDIFAPVAARIAAGESPARLGGEVRDFIVLPRSVPVRKGGVLHAAILFEDHFGNLVTNIERRHLAAAKRFRIEVEGLVIDRICAAYREGPEDAPMAIWGSYDLLEIAWRDGSAAQRTGLSRGCAIEVCLA